MNKVIHDLITTFFAVACWCLWGMLTLISNVMLRVSDQPPAFTRFCVGLRPLFVVLPIVAAVYCLYVWIRKQDIRRSWVGFFAATMSSLVLVMLPTMIAVWLPVFQFIELTGKKP
jgi:hypothetical protein